MSIDAASERESRPGPLDSLESAARRFAWRGWWAALAVAVAIVPVSGVFTLNRVFYTRDLSLIFWGRYLWFRRNLLSGQWPLWDPYIGAGQSAVADALNQMFLLPTVALRLVGSEVVGFNLWVALPFPLAALGTYLFLRRRFSPSASALGAIAFAVSGPVVSTGNFPNLSWSVAAMPWMLWAIDRVIAVRRPADVALLALAFACQALAGEPVTMTATGAVGVAYALWVGPADRETGLLGRLRGTAAVGAGLAVGFAAAAIQFLPLAEAVRDSWRSDGTSGDFWALHPLAVAEMFSPHLFGDYFRSLGISALPWMRPLNSGRDPFFYSIYFGTALVSLALFGLVAGERRRWAWFWTVAGLSALFAAFGSHTLFYPFLKSHLPVVETFRFPVKYLLVLTLALAALAAAGWDALLDPERRSAAPSRYRAAQIGAVTFPALVALLTYALAGACLYLPNQASHVAIRLARYVGIADPTAAADYVLTTLPDASSRLMLLALAGGLFLAVASTRRREAVLARAALYGLIGVELVAAAWDINPTFDAVHFRQPGWISATRGDEQSRTYIGGKLGSLYTVDHLDGGRMTYPITMSPAEGRSASAVQKAYSPAAWRLREMLSYDLGVLWPRRVDLVASRFYKSDRATRDRFLWRTGVRYRILPTGVGGGRPSVPVDYVMGVRLFDWGPVFPRVSIVPKAMTVPDVRQQVDQLFSPAFDPTQTVSLSTQAVQVWGRPGQPVAPFARVTGERPDEMTVQADVPATGGYLLVLDSFSPGWHVTVDDSNASMLKANALFRAVRLVPGRHIVVFRYLPASFLVGASISAVSGLAMLGLWAFGRRRTHARRQASDTSRAAGNP